MVVGKQSGGERVELREKKKDVEFERAVVARGCRSGQKKSQRRPRMMRCSRG